MDMRSRYKITIFDILTTTAIMIMMWNLTFFQKDKTSGGNSKMTNHEEQIQDTEEDFNWELFLDALSQVESSGRVTVINEAEKAYGILQITQGALDDVNTAWGTEFTLEDCIDPKYGKEISRTICHKYITMYKWNGSYKEAAGCWCGGPSWNRKRGVKKERIKNHWIKVNAEISKMLKVKKYRS